MKRSNAQPFQRILFFVTAAGCAAALALYYWANVQPPDGWKSVETKHFTLYYRTNTHAARRIREAAQQFDQIYEQEASFAPAVTLPRKPKLYLHEQLSLWGYAEIERLTLHSIYNEDQQLVSGHELMHLFLDRINPDAPMRYEEGICRMFEAREVPYRGRTYLVSLYKLARLTAPAGWTIRNVFQPAYNTDDEGNLAAAFAMMTLQRFGRDKFWQFHRELTETNWPEVLSRFYGQSLDEIDRDFHDFVAGLNPFP